MTPPELFDRLPQLVRDAGPAAAAETLATELRAAGDYPGLFYARLLQARVKLNAPPFPNGPSGDLPPAVHEPYEEAIRGAAREAGGLLLAQGDIPRAWGFFRLIGEPGPVKQALADLKTDADTDVYAIADLAWHQQLHPEKGFDLILDRHGICSAITLVSSTDLSSRPAVREYATRKLVRALHEQLLERLGAEVAARGWPTAPTAKAMIAGRPELFADDAYHVDVSHLGSVVQLAMHLPPGPDLDSARDLCEYGKHLAPVFRGGADAPFAEGFADYQKFLDALSGDDDALEYFHAAAKQEAADGNPFPTDIYLNLLLRLDRLPQAAAAAKVLLAGLPDDGLSCPPAAELCRRAGDFAGAAELARAKGDAVNYLAGLIASASPPASGTAAETAPASGIPRAD